MLSAYLCCAIICVISAILGQAICGFSGADRWTWTAPAVGFAALLVIVDAAIRLPGGGWASLTAVGLCLAVSVVLLARQERQTSFLPTALIAAPVVVIVAVLASSNYILNENFGIPGVSVLNDFAGHLPWAEALRTHHAPFSLIIPGYPLGSFALAGTLGRIPGVSVLAGFQGILIATPVLIAVTTLSLFERQNIIYRTIAAAAVALTYLVTSALVEGAFKEPIEALLVVAIALWLREFGQRKNRTNMGGVVPLAILAAGSVANYSYPGLTWPVLIIGSWIIFEILLRRRSLSWALTRTSIKMSLFALALFIVLVMPEAFRFHAFAMGQVAIANTDTGNVPFALPWSETLGVWFRDDFRFRPVQPVNVYHALLTFALAVFAFGVIRAIRRRETSLLALLVGTLAVALYVRGVATAYNGAKAMMVLSCAVVLVGVYGLLPQSNDEVQHGVHHSWAKGKFEIAGKLIAVIFAALCLWSASLAVRGSYVGPTDHANELADLRPLLAGHKVLFLAQDDFSAWELRGTRLAYITIYDIPSLPISFRQEKPFIAGQPVDFDSITSQSLDDFEYVVAPRTQFASFPPANWRSVLHTSSYQVWARTGDTKPHKVLEEQGSPGAVFNCSASSGRALSRTHGLALVRSAPIVIDGGTWQGPVLVRQPGESVLAAGAEVNQRITLPPGRWQLSMQYTSSTPVKIDVSNLDSVIPATLEHQGPYWPVGSVISIGQPLTIQVKVHSPPPLITTRYSMLGSMAFVRLGEPQKSVPLSAACGRYVDWYVER